ncbi:MAG: hypothetical protein ACLU30_12525 [Odoribacter splanchnicus]
MKVIIYIFYYALGMPSDEPGFTVKGKIEGYPGTIICQGDDPSTIKCG